MTEEQAEKAIELFEKEGLAFARYWMMSEVTPSVPAEEYDRIVGLHVGWLLEGWEDKNRAILPENDDEAKAFIQQLEDAFKDGWKTIRHAKLGNQDPPINEAVAKWEKDFDKFIEENPDAEFD